MGIRTKLQHYDTTALGASEVTLLELANAYRFMASGIHADPHVVDRMVHSGGEAVYSNRPPWRSTSEDDLGLSMIQEWLRGVVRILSGTAHVLDSRDFPITVMGKTGTTNDYRDALFVGSTYGPDGITIAVRVGFDDNRSLGAGETGARAALPIFREIMLKTYQEQLFGAVPSFPAGMEENIDAYLRDEFKGKPETQSFHSLDGPKAAAGQIGDCSIVDAMLAGRGRASCQLSLRVSFTRTEARVAGRFLQTSETFIGTERITLRSDTKFHLFGQFEQAAGLLLILRSRLLDRHCPNII